MSKAWSLVRLDKILQLQRRWLMLNPTEMYTEIGIRSFGKGIFHKTPVLGASLGNKRVLQIQPGDIVFSNVFAWEGAVAVAGEAEAGKIGSHRFVTYTAIGDQCNVEYLRLFFCSQSGLEVLRKVSPGSAGRNRTLNIAQFAKQEIPLPPLKEQLRIVARVEELAGKIEEARSLRQQAIEETEVLMMRTTATLLDNDEWLEFPLNELLRENSLNGLSPCPSDTPPGTPILRISAATSRLDAIVDETDFKYLEVSEEDTLKYRLEPGDLLSCRYNGNLHFAGRFALYRGSSGKQHLYPDKLIRFRVNTEMVLPEFVCLAMNSLKGRIAIESFCATTAGNIGLSAGKLKTVLVPVPPLPEQRRIVAYLDNLQAKVDEMKRLREQAIKELNALLPSLLDKAFKGEL